jgi:hypothetical protein
MVLYRLKYVADRSWALLASRWQFGSVKNAYLINQTVGTCTPRTGGHIAPYPTKRLRAYGLRFSIN